MYFTNPKQLFGERKFFSHKSVPQNFSNVLHVLNTYTDDNFYIYIASQGLPNLSVLMLPTILYQY